MNPAPAAARLLLADPSEDALNALYYLAPSHVPAAIPVLIARLDDPAEGVRAIAEERLRRWTGQSFGHAWDGYRRERPTRAEGRAMQPAWRAWWAAHAATFRPIVPEIHP
ncbi:MAG TPA: hypothetical protein VGQ83_01095 [Polyangia bacterium]